MTLGLGEMVTVLIASPWLVPLVGGPSGMRGITDAAIGGFGFRDPQHFYYLALAFVLFALFVSWRLASSRIGRAWTAMREDEQTADAMGISTTRFKLLAFAIGGAIGSLGGALFAVKIGSLTPGELPGHRLDPGAGHRDPRRHRAASPACSWGRSCSSACPGCCASSRSIACSPTARRSCR